ncbi:MAG: 1-deoxy-D-xylulose-5-phosphate reductoisomerase [Pelovirga sp.]
MKNIAVLGSTGSIGVSTLQIVEEFPDAFQIVALTAGSNLDLLCIQARKFRPLMVAVINSQDADSVRERLSDLNVEVCCGVEGMIQCATLDPADMVVAAVVGAAGLVPTMAAIQAGKDIALANKETLVMAGSLIMEEVSRQGVKLLPVDSEHSAIFQALAGHHHGDIRRLILTASGGPFRERPAAGFSRITPAHALAHPNWSMGKKITIDSATLMNKGLEVIEAHWLFAVPTTMIDVHIHPESIIHSMVEYVDGSVIAQLGVPDMKTPIAYALSWPQRLPLNQPGLDLCQLGKLNFSAPDLQRFPCLALAYQALESGGTLPAVMNAANEVAVAAFLNEQILFTDIPELIKRVMACHSPEVVTTVERVLQADRWARGRAREFIAGGLT